MAKTPQRITSSTKNIPHIVGLGLLYLLITNNSNFEVVHEVGCFPISCHKYLLQFIERILIDTPTINDFMNIVNALKYLHIHFLTSPPKRPFKVMQKSVYILYKMKWTNEQIHDAYIIQNMYWIMFCLRVKIILVITLVDQSSWNVII